MEDAGEAGVRCGQSASEEGGGGGHALGGGGEGSEEAGRKAGRRVEARVRRVVTGSDDGVVRDWCAPWERGGREGEIEEGEIEEELGDGGALPLWHCEWTLALQ